MSADNEKGLSYEQASAMFSGQTLWRLRDSRVHVPTRLRELLETVAYRNPGAVSPVTLTLKQMASVLGSTPETVSRTIAQWCREGWCERSGYKLYIRNKAKAANETLPGQGL